MNTINILNNIDNISSEMSHGFTLRVNHTENEHIILSDILFNENYGSIRNLHDNLIKEYLDTPINVEVVHAINMSYCHIHDVEFDVEKSVSVYNDLTMYVDSDETNIIKFTGSDGYFDEEANEIVYFNYRLTIEEPNYDEDFGTWSFEVEDKYYIPHDIIMKVLEFLLHKLNNSYDNFHSYLKSN